MNARRLALVGAPMVLLVCVGGTTDAQTPPVTAIAGTVADDRGAPLAAATVTVTSVQPRTARTTTTDPAGRFRVDALAPGVYTLAATASAGYAPRAFGHASLEDAGTPIRLVLGQQFSATITLPRTSSISGQLLDESGAPATGSVRAMAWVRRNGSRTRQSFTATADDDGHYRIANLSPGSYTITANGAYTGGDVRRMTPALIDRAARAVAHPDEPIPPLDPASAPTFTFVPVFYPNAATDEDASLVTLAPSEDRTGIDLRLRTTPTTQIDVAVFDHRGLPVNSTLVEVIDAKGQRPAQSPLTDKDGQFRMGRLLPGPYTLLVHHGVRLSGPGEPAAVVDLWGATSIVATIGSVAKARIDLFQGVQVTGRVVFEGASAPPADLRSVRVELVGIDGLYRPLATAGNMLTRTDAQGRFTIEDVPPGAFAVQVAGLTGPWSPMSIMAGSRDALDTGLAVELGTDVSGIVVTVTDRGSEVTGIATDAAGRPVMGGYVAVFPDDPRLWTKPSRAIVSARFDSTGRFTVRGLPPGRYIASLVSDPMPGGPLDPTMLAALVTGGTRFALADGERTSIAIQVK